MLSSAETEPRHDLVVVDDDDFIHEKIKRNLRKTSWRGVTWEVVSFIDPEEALAFLGAHSKPDLLIVDNRMPCMDGLDLIARLDWPQAWTKDRVYLATGAAPPPDIVAQAGQLGVGTLLKDDFLDKDAFDLLLKDHEAQATTFSPAH